MEFVEKQLSTKVTYEGKVINITLDDIELPDGKKSFREVIRHPGGFVAVAMKDENTILMVKQYRYAIQKVSIELPAGKLEKDEDIHDAIKRELLEETGYRAKNWKDLGYINTTPGICDEKLYLFLATDLYYDAPCPDDGEIIEAYEYKLDDIFKMIKDGEINDSKTICALMRAFKL